MTDGKEPDDTGTPPGTPPEPPKADPPKADDPPGGSSSDTDDLEAKIEKAVRKVLGEHTSTTPRRVDIEAQAEKMVRDAQQRLADEEKHKKEHETIAEKVKETVETAPAKARRLTKALWGEDKQP